jgi:hypothetical protein
MQVFDEAPANSGAFFFPLEPPLKSIKKVKFSERSIDIYG